MLEVLRQRVSDPNIFRVYATTFVLGTAYGIAISVLPLHLADHGFGKASIGELAAFFAAGIVAAALPMGWLIRRFSAKSTLAASLFGYALTVGLFPLLDSYWSIAFVRFFDGAFSVGVWVSSETILLQRAKREHKAFVTSIYAIAIAVGYVVGPLAARLFAELMPRALAFGVSSALALCAAAYVTLRIERGSKSEPVAAHEPEPEGPRDTALGLLWRIKNSCFATFAYGYFQASVVLFLPLYLVNAKGVPENDTILVTAFFAGGMLLFSNYAGRLGDRLGHLAVMRVLGSVGLSMILLFAFLDSFKWMCAAVFVAGASLASISPLSLALQGVISTEYSRATAVYNVFYAAGMLLGPPISSRIFEARGGADMLFHLAALWAAFVVFSIVFYRDDPAVARRALAAARTDGVPAP